jgi:dihydrofolate synthase/folylpolyglutamate synthase
MTFNEAYTWILSLSNIPRKEYMSDPRACGWYLDRLQAFLDVLGNPEKKIKHYIHVTGTSGKGSTTAFMHGILHTAGHNVGSTYSPHPSSIIERWKIGDAYMSEKEFVSIVEYLKPKLDEYIRTTKYDMISFFELTEAIGFIFFARHRVTHVVMEVACGGRYDSSNIIPHKDIAIITNIGLDHVGIIGNNKSEIAYEKAGIITKKTMHAITSEKNTRFARIIEAEAQKYHIPYTRINKPTFTEVSISKTGTSFVYDNTTFKLRTYGAHQIHNAVLCIEAAKKLNIDLKHITKGLRDTIQPLRMEVVSHKPLTILDGAHNRDKIRSTTETITTLLPLFGIKNLHLIISFSGDKDVFGMLKQLLSLRPTSISITRNSVNPFRKVAAMDLIRAHIRRTLPTCKVEIFLDPKDAYAYTKRIAKSSDCIVATGSIFMSGELREKLL